jgi:uncharacterized protein DUF4019
MSVRKPLSRRLPSVRLKGITLLIVLLITLCAMVQRTADAADKSTSEQATQAANAWLKLVDDGDYGDSWDQASSLFRDNVPKETWQEKVGAVRQPLGALVWRKVAHTQYTTSLPGVPDGQYVVIRYQTSFANKKSAVETVTPMLDKDSHWRVSGYYIR